ncbi:MAG TPA: tetratricopeptide repeat-containing serine protease family protein [Thermodesulfovibrionales bacterium]|nr:tetratricopeptide repeat-containing serine protease family protein [Thermodesulfovibrionales bacterium]
MRKRNCFFITFFVPVILLLLTSAAFAAENPGSVPLEKNAIVTIHIDDRNGTHLTSGNGFVVDSRGLIATSCLLISKWIEKVENSISVEFEGGTIYPMEHVISNSCDNNLVIISIKADGLPSVKIATASKPQPGERVKVISAFPPARRAGVGGVIKTVRRTDSVFQLDIQVAPEHDGSTVFNSRGEVMGIMTFPGKKADRHIVVPAQYVLRELKKCRPQTEENPAAAPAAVHSAPPSPVSGPIRADENAKLLGGKAPTSAEDAFLLAFVYEKANMYIEAVEAYNKALTMKPDYPDAYINLGLTYYKLEKYPEAIDAYKKAARLKPDTPSIYNKIAGAYIVLGQYPLAIEAFKESIRIDPGNSETHFNLGVTYLMAEDKDGAINEYITLKDMDTKRADKLLDLIF